MSNRKFDINLGSEGMSWGQKSDGLILKFYYECLQMSFTKNVRANLMGEVLILNVGYLLEDGVELMIQYFYFDKEC